MLYLLIGIATILATSLASLVAGKRGYRVALRLERQVAPYVGHNKAPETRAPAHGVYWLDPRRLAQLR